MTLTEAEDKQVCLICDAPTLRLISYPHRSSRRNPLLCFDRIAICADCGLGMALPRPSQTTLDQFYRDGSFWTDVGENVPQIIHERVQTSLRIMHCMPRLPIQPLLRVLDVGAGHGWGVEILDSCLPGKIQRFDFIEPDARNAGRILAKSARFPISRLESLRDASDRYHLIFLNHVIEHVADPVRLTRDVARLLTDDGIAHIEMPHSDYRFKEDVFPHTLFFTPESLGKLAHAADVEQILCEEFGRWPPAGPVTRAVQLAFAVAANFDAAWWLQRRLDHALWRYHKSEPGIWLRWVIRKR